MDLLFSLERLFGKSIDLVTHNGLSPHMRPHIENEVSDLGAVLEPGGSQRIEAGEVQEEELVRKGEVLVQQTVAGEGAARIREHGVVFVEADRAQRIGRQAQGPDAGAGRGVADQDLVAAAAQQLVERVNHAALAVEEEAQRFQVELREIHLTPAAQLDAESGDGLGGLDGGPQTVRRSPFGLGNAERPDHRVIAGPELARDARHGTRQQRAATSDLEARADLRLFRPHLKLDHGHGGDRAKQVRIDDAEQRLGHLGKLVVDLQVNARGQESEGFQQPLDVRVLALIGLEVEAGGDLGILLAELRAHLAQERQLPLVVEKQVVAHPIRPSLDIRPCSVASPCRKRSARVRGPFSADPRSGNGEPAARRSRRRRSRSRAHGRDAVRNP